MLCARPPLIRSPPRARWRSAFPTPSTRFCTRCAAGRTGDGWPFGRDVVRSEVLQVIDDVPGVDHVVRLELRGPCGVSCGRPVHRRRGPSRRGRRTRSRWSSDELAAPGRLAATTARRGSDAAQPRLPRPGGLRRRADRRGISAPCTTPTGWTGGWAAGRPAMWSRSSPGLAFDSFGRALQVPVPRRVERPATARAMTLVIRHSTAGSASSRGSTREHRTSEPASRWPRPTDRARRFGLARSCDRHHARARAPADRARARRLPTARHGSRG